MKIWKKIALIALGFFALVFINGCYYVFVGQNKSAEKLKHGEELNLYECCSIYTMHMAVWMFGWPMSIPAARECFMLHFPQEDVVRIHDTSVFKSPKIEKVVAKLSKSPDGTTQKVSWYGNDDYSVFSPERKTAIAVNPCRLTKYTDSDDQTVIVMHSLMRYPSFSLTFFNLGFIKLGLHEELFRYLQDKHWLSCFVAEYRMSVGQ